jgi:hypothetical protein
MKLYVVSCIQNKQPEKLKEFFEKLTPDIQVRYGTKFTLCLSSHNLIMYGTSHKEMFLLHELALIFAKNSEQFIFGDVLYFF